MLAPDDGWVNVQKRIRQLNVPLGRRAALSPRRPRVRPYQSPTAPSACRPPADAVSAWVTAMGLEQQLDERLWQAIKERDTQTADVVRMLKTRLQERRTAKGFSGAVDDALVLDVIGAYRKQLQKALPEFEKAGERGAAHVAQLRFEVAFCERYLPKGLDEAALRALVGQRLAALGITDGKQVGRLVGDIMKTHKGHVEAGDVKRIAEELLRRA